MSDGAEISAEEVVVIRDHLVRSRCAIERFACELRCDRVRAATLESQVIERNLCLFDWQEARRECLTEPDPTARAACQGAADEAYAACIAELDAEAQAAYEACRLGCAERYHACERKALEEEWDWDQPWSELDQDTLPGPPLGMRPAAPSKSEE